LVVVVQKKKRPLPADLLHRIVERSDGSPLYIEELTKAVVESNLPNAIDAPSIAIPDTLQELLIARLHHAAPAREVAQIGAAIGREFPQDLLEMVSSTGRPALNRTLQQLVDSDLLHRSTSASGTVYIFKHDLVRDASYETLLFAQRRTLHRRIAEALENRFPATVETQPELLAEHWERAAAIETAVKYWIQAGKRTAARSAVFEADAHLRRAYSLVGRLPKGRARAMLALDISVQHGGVLRVTHGPPSIKTGRMFARACKLCRKTHDDTLLVPSLSGLFAYHFVRAENARAAATAEQLLAFAEAGGNRQHRMIGHRTVGMALAHTGNLPAARRHLEQSLQLYDETSDGAVAFLYGTDHAQTAAGFLAKTLWLLGLPDAAAARESWAMAHALKVDHLFSLVQAKMFRITVRLFARDWEAAAVLAQETKQLATRHSLRFASTFSSFCLAASRCARCPDAAIVKEMRDTAEAWGRLNYRPLFLALIAEAEAAIGDPDKGLRVLADARSVVDATDERWIEPELYRLLGQIELMRSRPSIDEAEASYRKAIAVAHRQAARSYELRSSISLAHLMKRRGRSPEARTVLAPIYASLTEGFDTHEVSEARHLLQEL
jgi:tetratricopeptide (TPR) repeat protein